MRIEPVLGLQDPRGQRRLVVPRQHRDRRLAYDGTLVDLGADQVNAAAVQLDPGGQRPRMGVQPGKGRQ